jgi:type II secretory pathway pseudopilin PulG
VQFRRRPLSGSRSALLRDSFGVRRWAFGVGRSPHPPSGAFTLIELLVVLTIIIILMGLLFPAFRGVQDQAKRTQAKNDLVQIVTAINAYNTEYGKYPVIVAAGSTTDSFFGAGTAPTGSTSAGSNDLLLDVLRNITGGTNNATVTSLNPRQVVFISPPDVKDTTNPRGGIGKNGQYYDPWGTIYDIVIDTNYDNQITNPYPDTDGSAGAAPLRAGAIAYSLGKDGVSGTKSPASANYKNSDDVLSWQ